MRLLVVDPTLLVAGIVGPSSPARKLLVLLAYGRNAQLVRLYGRSEREADSADLVDGTPGGPSYDALIAAAEDRVARMEELLPEGAPDDLGLVVSQPMLAEIDEIVDELQHLMSLDPGSVRRQIVIHAAVLVGEASADVEPRWERSSSRRERRSPSIPRRHLLDAAQQAGAREVVTDDDRIAGDEAVTYEDRTTGALVTAVSLGAFAERLGGSWFNLEAVDPAVLAR